MMSNPLRNSFLIVASSYLAIIATGCGFQESTYLFPSFSAAISRFAAWLTETSRRFGMWAVMFSHFLSLPSQHP